MFATVSFFAKVVVTSSTLAFPGCRKSFVVGSHGIQMIRVAAAWRATQVIDNHSLWDSSIVSNFVSKTVNEIGPVVTRHADLAIPSYVGTTGPQPTACVGFGLNAFLCSRPCGTINRNVFNHDRSDESGYLH